VTKHQRAGQSLATTTYGARVLPEAVSMLFSGYDRVDLMSAQGALGWKNTNVPTFELLDREVHCFVRMPSCNRLPLTAHAAHEMWMTAVLPGARAEEICRACGSACDARR